MQSQKLVSFSMFSKLIQFAKLRIYFKKFQVFRKFVSLFLNIKIEISMNKVKTSKNRIKPRLQIANHKDFCNNRQIFQVILDVFLVRQSNLCPSPQFCRL